MCVTHFLSCLSLLFAFASYLVQYYTSIQRWPILQSNASASGQTTKLMFSFPILCQMELNLLNFLSFLLRVIDWIFWSMCEQTVTESHKRRFYRNLVGGRKEFRMRAARSVEHRSDVIRRRRNNERQRVWTDRKNKLLSHFLRFNQPSSSSSPLLLCFASLSGLFC